MGGMETVALLRRFTKQTQSLHDMSETTKAAAKLGFVYLYQPQHSDSISPQVFLRFPQKLGFKPDVANAREAIEGICALKFTLLHRGSITS